MVMVDRERKGDGNGKKIMQKMLGSSDYFTLLRVNASHDNSIELKFSKFRLYGQPRKKKLEIFLDC